MPKFVKVPEVYPKLLELRKSTTASFKQNEYLKESTKLRYYQVIGALHMLLLSRMVLGDATGLGKTLQSIAAYTFLKKREHSLKWLVVCSKSAVYQWGEEIDKFCNGITYRVITNDCRIENGKIVESKAGRKEIGRKARMAQYEAFKEDVLIMHYAPILEEYEIIKQILGQKYMVSFDECFEYHTPVTLEDGSEELIGKIVSKKLKVKVLSQNPETGKIEIKRVTDYFRSLAEGWYKVKSVRGKSSVPSPRHKFYTDRGEVQAQDLKKGDILYGVEKKYTDIQKQIVLGSLIGDGALGHSKRFDAGKNTCVRMMQSTKRKDYLLLKAMAMAHHVERIAKQKSGWNRLPMWTIHTYATPILSDFLRSLKITGKKEVTQEWLNALTPLGLAIWYCDDGSLSGTQLSLHIEGFGKKGCHLIQHYFKEKWGIEFSIGNHKKKKLHWLYTEKSKDKFLKIVSDYIPACMSYKTDRPCGLFWSSFQGEPLEWGTFEDRVEYSKPHIFKTKTFNKYRYNIEVEDNHNYFAGGSLVSNCTNFKNRKTKTHFAAQQISESAERVYGLSATIIKNGLEEVYGIYNVVVPGLFGRITHFKKDFCVEKKMKLRIRGKLRHIPKVIGYKNLKEFKKLIDPYLLVRKKHEVASELPSLISRKVVLEMDSDQTALYKEALSGVLHEEKVRQEYFEISDAVRNGADDEKTLKKFGVLEEKYRELMTAEGKKKGKLAALTYCQMVSNGPGLIQADGSSSKEAEFERLITEELVTEKIIVFTRFKSGIPFLEKICNQHKIGYAKIHGDITDPKVRAEERQRFTNDEDCRVIFITTAGSESLNLQVAGVLIFYDTPWSWGDLVQTIGRAQRIGSIQEHILLLHLVNKGTIDMRVMNTVADKKNLSDTILGDTAKGALDFSAVEESVINDLYDGILEDAEAI